MKNSLMVSAQSESTIEPVPQGLHLAACVALYDVGVQYSEKYGTTQRKAIFSFELPDLPPLEVKRDGKRVPMPRCLSRRYTLSLNEKAALRGFLESWRGRKFTESELGAFDLAKLLGVAAQIQIMHGAGEAGKIYANVTAALPAPRGVSVAAKTPLTMFSVATLTKPELPKDLPEWVGKLVMESRDWEKLLKKAATASAAAPAAVTAKTPAMESPIDNTADDVPF